ncbi:YwqI/YxiC family protein [Alkalihalophilus lindianensis]|uniref:YwqI/YxiC family protein n=1 Tax=Alkalihalophilus lindianensis TaxID=1630542 RepID=A0ABU3XG58_9BACI|nr:YwqI/YxiC family protein [Alkalihalophilus lindianensis]MDV2686597.1 YwqI/YxiC family protein [Alkalihalophilus lindianensis]
MSEIKILYADVEQELAKLQNSIQALDPSMPTAVGANNVLEVVDRMNQLNQQMNQMVEAYQALLLKNEQDTLQALETMKEADQQVSSQIMTK